MVARLVDFLLLYAGSCGFIRSGNTQTLKPTKHKAFDYTRVRLKKVVS